MFFHCTITRNLATYSTFCFALLRQLTVAILTSLLTRVHHSQWADKFFLFTAFTLSRSALYSFLLCSTRKLHARTYVTQKKVYICVLRRCPYYQLVHVSCRRHSYVADLRAPRSITSCHLKGSFLKAVLESILSYWCWLRIQAFLSPHYKHFLLIPGAW